MSNDNRVNGSSGASQTLRTAPPTLSRVEPMASVARAEQPHDFAEECQRPNQTGQGSADE